MYRVESGFGVASLSEAWPSQTCPPCGRWNRPRPYQETLTCLYGFEGHADLVASRTLLEVLLDALPPRSGPIPTIAIGVAATSAQGRVQLVSLHCAVFDVTLEDADNPSRPFLATAECPAGAGDDS